MREPARRTRNTERLGELYPTFAVRVGKVLCEMEHQGYRPRIQDAYRPPADQLRAFEAGTSAIRYGFHNITGVDGRPEALAVDILDDDEPTAPSYGYLLRLSRAAEDHGLGSGIRWGLCMPKVVALNRVLTQRRWLDTPALGWDPTHIECRGISVVQAMNGRRPV